MPSIGIYSYELFTQYDVENIIRIGSAGSMQKNVHIRDVIIAQVHVQILTLLINMNYQVLSQLFLLIHY